MNAPLTIATQAERPLAGRRVAVVHPAWHSCGAYEVYVGQTDAYRALGAEVFTVVCNDQPGFEPNSARWSEYRRLTPEMEAMPRFFAGVSFARFLTPAFFSRAVIPYWQGDGAAMREGFAERSDVSPGALSKPVDLVHCNHFFCMPVAHRVARGAPIVLDTIDVQARQFDIINDAARFVLPPRASFDAMLAQELTAMRPAAGLLHLNAEELDFFRAKLPDRPHHLLYPAVRVMHGVEGGNDILIVASNNTANVESLIWFLREVLPRAGNPSVVIAGNVDGGVRAKDSTLYERHRAKFLGRVNDLAAVYARARLLLLPTISGTGVSIKAVEALSTGLPLIASPLAFRGMTLDPNGLRNVVVADGIEPFATALRNAIATPYPPTAAEIAASDTRRAYDLHFSEAAYARHLAEIVMPLVAMTSGRSLAGKRVAIVHPAWHSCGTYSVVLGQIAAYRSLGADVVAIANSDFPGFGTDTFLSRRYVAQTPELDATIRAFAGVPLHRALRPKFLRDAILPFLHGDQAAMRAGASAASEFSPELTGKNFDLVHCNHFFCMPIARKIARGRPILLDTHDLQAQQFDLINDARPILPPRTTRAEMLARELAEMRDAAALLHLNADEEGTFRDLLPGAPHHLLYPPVPDVPTGPGGDDIVLVSSWNAANLESMLWFLRDVMPRAGNPAIKIAGNIDAGVRSADRALYKKYRHLFLGRVDHLGAVYAGAKLALLPTIAGTGLSIKTVEAMASGLPLIASPLAFRGMAFELASLGNVTIAADADAFAVALRAVASSNSGSSRSRLASDTRRAYEATFSEGAYAAQLAKIAAPLLAA